MEESLKKFVDESIGSFDILLRYGSFDLSFKNDGMLAQTIFESTIKLIEECNITSKD